MRGPLHPHTWHCAGLSSRSRIGAQRRRRRHRTAGLVRGRVRVRGRVDALAVEGLVRVRVRVMYIDPDELQDE